MISAPPLSIATKIDRHCHTFSYADTGKKRFAAAVASYVLKINHNRSSFRNGLITIPPLPRNWNWRIYIWWPILNLDSLNENWWNWESGIGIDPSLLLSQHTIQYSAVKCYKHRNLNSSPFSVKTKVLGVLAWHVMSQPSSRHSVTDEPCTSIKSTTAPDSCMMFCNCCSHWELSSSLSHNTMIDVDILERAK